MNAITVTHPFQPPLHGHLPLPPPNWREWQVKDNTGDYRTLDELGVRDKTGDYRTKDEVERILASHPNIPTKPGRAVIILYSKDGEFVAVLNRALRRRISSPIVFHIRDLLNESLRLMPAEPALISEPLYRRIQIDTEQELEELFERYESGKIVTEHAFTSTSRGGVAPKYRKRNVEFVIFSNSGRDISGISVQSEEWEVLIPAGARFKVTYVKREDLSGLSRIELVEVK